MQEKNKKNSLLLELARNTLKSQFNREKLDISKDIKRKYSEKKACFITLTEDGELRGCIGSLNPHQELWKDIVDNSISAAFRDPRFLPLSSSELNNIKIEISVLSAPKKIYFRDYNDLLKKMDKKMGIILKKGFYSSTFLPQVWKEIPDKTEFLENLSRKAGLDKNDWKDSEIWYYEVKSIKEE
ncbi:AmmeMemoRadiSam system protein A [Candidatus Pacearchaeota archaeon]|nr:AmmeMemoRadiSam system protein A [Candidatus Pacearchaeota archaeon]